MQNVRRICTYDLMIYTAYRSKILYVDITYMRLRFDINTADTSVIFLLETFVK